MAVTAAQVKELREISGAGMSACKSALDESGGDVKRAVEILREKGLAAAAKKAGRVAAEGLVMVEVSADRKSGAIVEVNSETDFVAKNEDFVNFVKQVAKQALASSAETVDDLTAEKFIGDSTQTLKDVLTQKVSTIGENIGIRRFVRYNAASNGALVEYIHGGGRIGTLLEITSANLTDAVLEAGRNVCMQIASMSPQFVSSADISPEYIKSEKEILLKTALNENAESDKPKPQSVIENMVEGRWKKGLKEICLVDQEYVKADKQTVGEYLKSIGSDVTVTRFTRYEKGEGVEKKEENFAEEVAKAMQG